MSLTIEPVTRVAVTVTFLRMDQPPTGPARPFPPGYTVERVAPCGVPRYRELYNTVGAPYVWWLRRTLPDRQLAAHLRDRRVSIHELRHDGETCGFYELDGGGWPLMNLSYFGLMPHCVGRRLGTPFLRHAIEAAWSERPQAVTVNTCTADHPRALPAYRAAGFVAVRAVREEWSIPDRLGLMIPDRLRI